MRAPGLEADPADRDAGRSARRRRLRDLMERRGLGAVVLRLPANFAWYTGGGDSGVDQVAPLGVADVVVTPEAEYVLTSAIEAPRMRSEQAPGIEVVVHDWVSDPNLAIREVAAGCGGSAPTRLPGPETARRVAACEENMRRLREEATRPGRTLAEAFADSRFYYEDAGFPGEWKLHHQGGTTGYGSREVIATPDTDDEIVVGNAFAWNPSITGAKAEETFLLADAGPEVIT